eukprot:gnl/TRDRNA2_/TRDRNA2_185732_c0_seq1.p1 gnl/TRDRNA2_/TRDRNA2_185732_c0~~gnl/TRDRNA2_/TRDRNA2_185732_c0_seq1.p1  ORF type:complete len:456 (+),score=40.75 gnl/TRDRNA2_/TRDRNA2_185732_c0_seq1:67-1434(+)
MASWPVSTKVFVFLMMQAVSQNLGVSEERKKGMLDGDGNDDDVVLVAKPHGSFVIRRQVPTGQVSPDSVALHSTTQTEGTPLMPTEGLNESVEAVHDVICLNAQIALNFENRRVLDWIAYHSLMGISCFIIHIDHCHSNIEQEDQSKTYLALKSLASNLTSLCSPCVKLKLLDIDEQHCTYSRAPALDFVSEVGALYHMNIDVDEFLVLDDIPRNGSGKYTGAAVPPNLAAFLAKVASDNLGVYVYRWDYGTSGYTDPPSISDMPEFVWLCERWGMLQRSTPRLPDGKYILNLAHASAPAQSVHTPPGYLPRWCPSSSTSLNMSDFQSCEDVYPLLESRGTDNQSRVMVLPDGQPFCPSHILSQCESPKSLQPLFLNHYMTGSLQECYNKAKEAFSIRGRNESECKEYHPGTEEYVALKREHGMVEDPIMVKFGTATRIRRAELFPTCGHERPMW